MDMVMRETQRSVPKKILEVNRPMSEELSDRSQRAVGNRKETHKISTASLALAHPHTTNRRP